MDDFKELLELPGTPQEQAWLEERLETLSVREKYVLAAVLMRTQPRDAEEAIDCLNSLEDYDVCPAGSYKELGRFSLKRLKVPEDVLPHVDLEELGHFFEDQHPGLFIGNCYVAYPKQSSPPIRQENGAPLLWDDSWSVKLKLASPAVPEGVWLRLPDYALDTDYGVGEFAMVLHQLEVNSLDDCTLLDAQCILPEAGDLTEQYRSVSELARDGNNLGHIMDEQGQGEPHWLEKFAAALEYEDCRTLRFALDISQNMHCYEWISSEGLADFAANHLRDEGVPEELIQSGIIDLDDYAEDLLETSGYMEASGETGYLIRNGREFIRDFTAPPQQDVLKALPGLEELFDQATPEEAASARAAISKALEGRGADGVRQLDAAMSYEDCANLEEAVEIAAHLDCYDFMEIDRCQEQARQELLDKGLSDRIISLCFNLDTYTAIHHEFEDLYTAHDAGLYVHKSDPSFQLDYWRERTGGTKQPKAEELPHMTMQ